MRIQRNNIINMSRPNSQATIRTLSQTRSNSNTERLSHTSRFANNRIIRNRLASSITNTRRGRLQTGRFKTVRSNRAVRRHLIILKSRITPLLKTRPIQVYSNRTPTENIRINQSMRRPITTRNSTNLNISITLRRRRDQYLKHQYNRINSPRIITQFNTLQHQRLRPITITNSLSTMMIHRHRTQTRRRSIIINQNTSSVRMSTTIRTLLQLKRILKE